MTEDEYTRKNLIKNLVDNPWFNRVMDEARQEIALKMLNEVDEVKRTELYNENKALDRVIGQLVLVANEVRAIDGRRTN